MSPDEIVRRAADAFAADVAVAPPLTLRGGNAVDDYDEPEPFDPALDEPTDEYLERFAYWALPYLDPQSWRHYLPRLISYALAHPDDPKMVTEALIRSLRPPDREPPRLSTLTAAQEAVIVAFLESVALDTAAHPLGEDASLALEEWWLPNARHRPAPGELAARRAAPVTYRSVEGDRYRLALPGGFTGGEVHDVVEEARRIQLWRGHLCGDAATEVFVNATPLGDQSLRQAVRRIAAGLRGASEDGRAVRVRGAKRARRLDGLAYRYGPAEPERVTVLFAVVGRELLTLTVRAWPRDDVTAEVERIVGSFEVVAG